MFALVAALLAAVGVYGVVWFTVSKRTQEIGVRMALGARPANVLRLVTVQAMAPAALGIVIGLASAAFLASFLESQLFGITPGDPLTYAAVALGLMGITLLACFLPARRAVRIDPAVALRDE